MVRVCHQYGCRRAWLAARPLPAARPRTAGSRAGPSAPVRCRAVLDLPTRSGGAQPGSRRRAAAVVCRARWTEEPPRGWFGRRRRPASGRGIYLDGGFGVGKTHLLASLWHDVPGPKAFGTFVEYTNLVGALGFQPTVEALSGHPLVCIDEFELDDPGDTVLMATLLGRLADAGVSPRCDLQHAPRRAGRGAVRRRGLPARDPGAGSRGSTS